MKRQIYWLGMMLLLFAFFFFTPFPGGTVMDGFSGLTIKFFLAYCAIIVVAQLYAALVALWQFLSESATRKKESCRQTLR